MKKIHILSVVRQSLIVFFWIGAVLMFLLSFGRIPQALDKLYQCQSMENILSAMFSRPVPTHTPALLFGTVLILVALSQVFVLKENYLKPIFLSLRMLMWALLYRTLGDILAWSLYRITPLTNVTIILLIVFLYFSFGALLLSIVFVRKLESLKITNQAKLGGVCMVESGTVFDRTSSFVD